MYWSITGVAQVDAAGQAEHLEAGKGCQMAGRVVPDSHRVAEVQLQEASELLQQSKPLNCMRCAHPPLTTKILLRTLRYYPLTGVCTWRQRMPWTDMRFSWLRLSSCSPVMDSRAGNMRQVSPLQPRMLIHFRPFILDRAVPII